MPATDSIESLATEEINPRTVDIDLLPTGEILRRINEEDALVAGAVARELPAIEAVVERVVAALAAGGRLIYVGSGTSGRLGVQDAAECYPTYGVASWQVRAVLAGAPAALTGAVEAQEDDEAAGDQAMIDLEIDARDVVLGIASSGRTPFVVAALRQARALGAGTAALVGNRDGPVAAAAELVIAPYTGPEVISGSTRMKAGTAQKLVLNMISTAAMIRAGRTFGNLMVDMKARNSKLRRRAERIVAQGAGVDLPTAARALTSADGEIKTAIVMLRAHTSAAEARRRLDRAHGVLRQALSDEQPDTARPAIAHSTKHGVREEG